MERGWEKASGQRRRRLKCEDPEDNTGEHRRPSWATLGRSGGHGEEAPSPQSPPPLTAFQLEPWASPQGRLVIHTRATEQGWRP